MNTTNSPPAPDRQPSEQLPEAEEKPAKIDLSATQILGGALAAMTAAALGSRIGVAGTIVGAALASIVAGVAGALYTASLRHTKEKVKTVFNGRIAGTQVPTSVDVVPDWDMTEAHPAPMPAAPSSPSTRRKVALPWKGMLVGALTAFALAAVALTGFELLSGTALSGGQGTTIQQVSKSDKAPTKEPTSKATAEDSETPSETPSPQPSDTPSSTPSTELAPTTPQPSETQTESPSVTPSPTPSATPTPSEATPSAPADPEG
jgi:hypothetical protein